MFMMDKLLKTNLEKRCKPWHCEAWFLKVLRLEDDWNSFRKCPGTDCWPWNCLNQSMEEYVINTYFDKNLKLTLLFSRPRTLFYALECCVYIIEWFRSTKTDHIFANYGDLISFFALYDLFLKQAKLRYFKIN